MNQSITCQPVKKVTLTQKVEQNQQQTIISVVKNSRFSLASGKFINHECEGIFHLHGGESDELETSQVVCTTHPAIIITLLLEGDIKFGYDDLEFDLKAGKHPQALIVNLTQPSNFHRQLIKGNHVTKLNIAINPRWLNERSTNVCQVVQFAQRHKAHTELLFTPKMLDITRRVLQISHPQTLSEYVQLEAASFALIEQCLTQISAMDINTLNPHIHPYNNVLDQVVLYIEDNLDKNIQVDQLAQQMAMSVSTLQNKFKQQFGMTVANYTRSRRLHIARKHLEKGYCTITEAAYEAGYNHPSNFSLAFKKAFGVSPQAFINNMSSNNAVS